MKLIAPFKDRPFIITVILTALVIGHASATLLLGLPNVWAGAAVKDVGDQVTLYLGTAAAAAILAGFAGVVVVFGLTSNSDRFRVFRISAGKSLRGNWTSTSLSGFVAAGMSLLSAIMIMNGPAFLAPWVFELSLAMMGHGIVRTVWILRELVTVVRNDDLLWHKGESTLGADNHLFK